MFGFMNYTPSFTPEFFIDVLQGTKRDLTNKIYTDPVLNKAANDFITQQSAFAKMLVNNMTAITKHFVDSQTQHYFPKNKINKEEK